jgi:ATP-dependent DNA helicase RecQ
MTNSLNINDILKSYWGYERFRPLQEEIIRSVLAGHDTLALLPTGGGKSVCFQVPAMAREGICLVITPLIALMKDQVENLKKKGIKASAIFSGMNRSEIELVVDNCLFGQTKFLYVSPERLKAASFLEAMKRMNVSLIAVDEAHCISQWGYDFRPPYLEIARIRDFFPGIPVLALTATATPEVVKDIQDKLHFRKQNVYQRSFERKNLVYIVFREEDKLGRLLRIVHNLKGTGIVYVRNRRKTREISDFLIKNGISSGYYHAGLEIRERETRQNEWVNGKIQVIVATNAFGMGIDKPDVRFVVHLDLADSIEAYFQEAGRAGRDEKEAYAVILYNQSDLADVQNNFLNSYPEPSVISNVYQLLGNYLQVPVGSGADQSFDFEIAGFCHTYNLKQITVYNSLVFLEREGYVSMNEALQTTAHLIIKVTPELLHGYQVANPAFEPLIKVLLRSYSGIFSDFIRIDESEIGRRADLPKGKVFRYLEHMHNSNVLTYIPRKDKPQLVFSQPRLERKQVGLSAVVYHQRKENARKRLDAVVRYVTSDTQCRSIQLLSYFGDRKGSACGRCDVCLATKSSSSAGDLTGEMVNRIRPLLEKGFVTIHELAQEVGNMNEEHLVGILRWLLENGKIETDCKQRYRWKQ